MMRGIDISAGSCVDFHALKKAGYDFVIARAGWGSFAKQKDSDFHNNVMDAVAAGLHVGAYWFMYFKTIPEAQQNAIAFNQVLEPYKGLLDMPVYLDYEGDTTRYYNQNSGKTETRDTATSALSVACFQMEKLGWYTGYYCNLDYLKNHFKESDLEHFTRWLALWQSVKPVAPCQMWQSAGDVKINEARGKVDLDECYVDYPEIIRKAGLNGFQKQEGGSDDFSVGGHGIYGRPIKIFENGTWCFVD